MRNVTGRDYTCQIFPDRFQIQFVKSLRTIFKVQCHFLYLWCFPIKCRQPCSARLTITSSSDMFFSLAVSTAVGYEITIWPRCFLPSGGKEKLLSMFSGKVKIGCMYTSSL